MTDTINNSVPTPVMIYGRAPDGTLQAVTTDGSGNINFLIAASQITNGVTGSGKVVLATAPIVTNLEIDGASSSGVAELVLKKTAGDFSAKFTMDATALTGGKIWAFESTGGSAGEGQGKFVISIVGTADELIMDGSTAIFTGALVTAGVTPTTSTGQLGVGTTNGFGTGSAGTAVTTTTKGGGTGPTNAEVIVKYLEIDLAGAKYWIPLVQ